MTNAPLIELSSGLYTLEEFEAIMAREYGRCARLDNEPRIPPDMPCNMMDGCGSGPSDSDLRRVEGQLADTNAMLCGLLRVLSETGALGQLLGMMDEKRAGITRVQLSEWWERHQALDRARGL